MRYLTLSVLAICGALFLSAPAVFAQTLPGAQQNTQTQQPPQSPDALPPAPLGPQMDIREQAFDAAIDGFLPLKPDEIRELLERFDRTQEAVSLPVTPTPKPEVVVENIPLDPGAMPAIVKTAYGHVTTINVLDATGAPWPIEDISWAGDFEVVESSSENGSHILRISPQSEFAYGNISVRLLTLKTPVILTLETRRDSVHYRFDAIIPEYGPMAQVPLIQGNFSLTAGSAELSSILEGVIPSGTERLNVSGTNGRTTAYRQGDQIYVRTPLTLLSPQWSNSVSSADGMRVYTVANAPILLFSDGGKMIRARLSTREDVTNE